MSFSPQSYRRRIRYLLARHPPRNGTQSARVCCGSVLAMQARDRCLAYYTRTLIKHEASKTTSVTHHVASKGNQSPSAHMRHQAISYGFSIMPSNRHRQSLAPVIFAVSILPAGLRRSYLFTRRGLFSSALPHPTHEVQMPSILSTGRLIHAVRKTGCPSTENFCRRTYIITSSRRTSFWKHGTERTISESRDRASEQCVGGAKYCGVAKPFQTF